MSKAKANRIPCDFSSACIIAKERLARMNHVDSVSCIRVLVNIAHFTERRDPQGHLLALRRYSRAVKVAEDLNMASVFDTISRVC